MFPPDGGGSDEERRQRKAGVPGGERDPVFDVPLANDAFVRSMPRSDNGTRNSEFDGLVPDDPPPPQINSFTQIVSRLSSTEAIGRFMETAPPRVQAAVRNTVAGLLGNMKPFSVDASTVTTSENLANLMFQLQMTGYMFKNADYRLSLKQSLSGSLERRADRILPPPSSAPRRPASVPLSEAPVVRGTVSVAWPDGSGVVEVDAEAYVAELKGEVAKLRGDLLALSARRDAREEAAGNDLIAFVNGLPREEMQALTGQVNGEVLEAMESLVYGILRQFGVKENEKIMIDSSDAISKLMIWQLVIGYNLREIEVREEFKRQFAAPSSEGDMAMGAFEEAAESEDGTEE